jgi:hypothetical protein
MTSIRRYKLNMHIGLFQRIQRRSRDNINVFNVVFMQIPSGFLKILKNRHAEHKSKSKHWDLLTAVVEGGDSVDYNVKKMLLPNPDNRPADVINERIKVSTFVSKISPILSSFNAEIFSNAGTPTGSNDIFWSEEFFKNGALLDGDDDGRSSFLGFCQRAMSDALTTGKAIALVDTRSSSGAVSKLQQRESGDLNSYVMLLPRTSLWDWKADANGFLYAKIHQYKLEVTSWDKPQIPTHIFSIYERDETGRVLASRYVITRNSEGKEIPPEPFIEMTLPDKEINIEC